MKKKDLAHYFVVDGHTLAYRFTLPDMPGGFRHFGVLRSLYRKGGPLESQASTEILSRRYRPANERDFAEYRVTVPGHFALIQSGEMSA